MAATSVSAVALVRGGRSVHDDRNGTFLLLVGGVLDLAARQGQGRNDAQDDQHQCHRVGGGERVGERRPLAEHLGRDLLGRHPALRYGAVGARGAAVQDLVGQDDRHHRRAVEPRPHGAQALQGRSGLLRIRVGDYRVIYEVQDARLVVLVVDLGHRRDIYR
ncbi:type II toxin-antitoxin system RelE/ParE family toxin [Actinopolymorpha sp. NPDC004070]|uniref:type II toxin-antitoxin system RelE family toxin n=1 Tax=Actinopolymorpha sp. NPDC004070 TaxID=3154548 RepID=UPI00339DAAD7